jgi:hypothetical protein
MGDLILCQYGGYLQQHEVDFIGGRAHGKDKTLTLPVGPMNTGRPRLYLRFMKKLWLDSGDGIRLK